MFTYDEMKDAECKMDEAYRVYCEARRRYDMIRQTLHSEFMQKVWRNVPDETLAK